jgi:hypothetical protein
MAFNQVSLFFYPPRWQPCLRVVTWETLSKRPPIYIEDSMPSSDQTSVPLAAKSVVNWLKRRGFVAAEWNMSETCFRLGQVSSCFGMEQELEVSFGEESEEVTSFYCRFTLTRDPPPKLAAWADFMSTMCQEFQLRLGDSRTVCEANDFIEAVKRNHNWQDWSHQLGWE